MRAQPDWIGVWEGVGARGGGGDGETERRFDELLVMDANRRFAAVKSGSRHWRDSHLDELDQGALCFYRPPFPAWESGTVC